MEIKGKYNTAEVFTDNIDETTIGQVIELCNQSFVSGETIRIMPDCHAGAGCVIGTTMTLVGKKVVPNLVGVDIGCGMYVMGLGKTSIDFKMLDDLIHNEIPSGFSVRNKEHDSVKEFREYFSSVIADVGEMRRHLLSVGTLGGGNHFIEVNKDEEDNVYLVIHSGSRNFGKQIAEYWQKKAVETCQEETPKDLAYLSGSLYDDYIHDMKIAQMFATLNRASMAQVIVSSLKLDTSGSFETIHNYIDFESGILRKGAVSAREGEKLIIPINMRDGSIIATGKGNSNWNNSAPHGAGRILSRGRAKREVNMEEYRESMKGIYTTSVTESTLDESPMAYKSAEEIMKNIVDSVTIENIISPLYNFKSA